MPPASSTLRTKRNEEGSLRFHDDDEDDFDTEDHPHAGAAGLEDIDTFLEPTNLVLKHHEAEAKRKSITMAVQTVPHIVSRSIAGWVSAILIVAQLAAIIGFIFLPIIIVMAHHDFCFLCGGAEFLLVLSMSVIGILLLLIGLIYPLRQYIIEKKKQHEKTHEDLLHEQLEAHLSSMGHDEEFKDDEDSMMMDGGSMDHGTGHSSTMFIHDDEHYGTTTLSSNQNHQQQQHHHYTSQQLLSASSTSLKQVSRHTHSLRKLSNLTSKCSSFLSHYFGATSTKKKTACCLLSSITLLGFIWLAISILVVLSLLAMVRSTRIQKSGLLYSNQIFGKRAMIVREMNGMVHVVAENMKDLAFAQGVAACQDRLFQMELYKRVCQGTMSEIVGQDALIVDKLSRILGFTKYARDNLKHLPNNTIEIIQSYVNGINSFIASKPRLPPEFGLVGFQPTEWNVIDVLAFEKLIAFQMTYNYIFELARLVILENGATLERATELSTPSHAHQFTIFTREELNMTLSDEEAEEIERRLFDQSGAFIPQQQKQQQTSSENRMSNAPQSNCTGSYHPTPSNESNTFSKLFEESSNFLDSSDPNMFGIGHILTEIFNKNRYLNMLFPMKRGRSRGSNNWVIHRNLTDSSTGYNVNDPHLDFSSPIIFQQIHLKLVPDVSKVNEKDLKRMSSLSEQQQQKQQQQEESSSSSSSSSTRQQQPSSSSTPQQPSTQQPSSTSTPQPSTQQSSSSTSTQQPSTQSPTQPYDFELIGASFPGLPSIGIGRNAYISWSITLSFTDVQDLYVLTPCPHSPNTHYMMDGKPEPYQIRKEFIHIKDQQALELEVKESRFGPIFNTILMDPQIGNVHVKHTAQHYPIALKWTAHLANDTTLIGLEQMTRARNMDEFIKGTHLLSAFPFCIVFSDRNGNIGYSLTGITPIRQQGHTGMFPMPGNVSTFEYKGYASGSDLITLLNPKKGYIITANNRITPAGWPYIISNDNEYDYRAKRIDQMLSNRLKLHQKLTQKDMIEIQNDVQSLIFEELKFVFQYIKNRLQESELPPSKDHYLKYVNELLTEWNGKIERESTHAALFESFLNNLITLPQFEVSEKYWNDFYYLRRAMTLNNDTACVVDRKQTCQEFALQTFKETIDQLFRNFGNRIPKWKEMHYIDASHPILGLTPLACLSDRHLHTNGGTYTVNINNYVYDKITNTTIPTVNAAVYRQIIGGGEFSSPTTTTTTTTHTTTHTTTTHTTTTTGVEEFIHDKKGVEEFIHDKKGVEEFIKKMTQFGIGVNVRTEFINAEKKTQEDLWVLPLGQDGNMFSKNYDNMMNYYIEGKYYPLRTDLDREVTDVYTIVMNAEKEEVQHTV
ncbi:hypothetical protein C9374_009879 [Naegleria lovaniensis]|uniref:Uncharacterized protein n=1 Tax=Naegleria lovaniensis TaxID=51637 RepID=A0AA88GJC9_NAELO|nr:uncharacterized protein C9374_009879 [Naegleria lovaniensis]KAG2375256.1 hypothetical protein C9374_009879 [Naegleria lovaniensis]